MTSGDQGPTLADVMEAIAKVATDQATFRAAMELRMDTLHGEIAAVAAEFAAMRLDIQSERGDDISAINSQFAEAVRVLTHADKALSRRVAALEKQTG